MLKTFLRKLHLILGLVSGVLVFIISVTGALYAFKEEIEGLFDDYKTVQIENRAFLLPSEVFAIGQEKKPGVPIHGITYFEKDQAIEVVYYQPEPFFYGAAYVHPYTGEVIKLIDYKKTFFGFILHGHMALWLPLTIGKPVVAIVSLVFLVMLISGLILWIPANFRFKGAFSFTRKATAQRRQLELHKVFGFYVFLFALILLLTGLTWLFRGVGDGIYKTFGGEMETRFRVLPSDTTQKANKTFTGEAIDVLYSQLTEENPHIPSLEIHVPKDSVSSILVEINRDPSTYYKMDYLFYDQYTLKELTPDHIYGRYEVAGLPEKVRRMNYDIHTGNILALPGKLLAFIVSLFCASLPVTGFLLWWKRRKEKKELIKKLDI